MNSEKDEAQTNTLGGSSFPKRIRKPVDFEKFERLTEQQQLQQKKRKLPNEKSKLANTNISSTSKIEKKDGKGNNTKSAMVRRGRVHKQLVEEIIVEETPLVHIPPSLLPSVGLSNYDKALELVLSKDQLICYGCMGGYRMVRATHAVHRGAYYYEVEVLPSASENAHVRLGWSTRKGQLEGPVGYDKWSYAYRDIDGSKVHDSKRIDNYGPAYGPGDIIGCYIYLSQDPSENEIRFYKNGSKLNVAYKGGEVFSDIYFPAISLYCKANVRVNFGPTFIEKYDIPHAHPISELQPMNSDDRKVHERRIAALREKRMILRKQEF